MAEFSKLIITDKGQALIAKILSGDGNIEFTKISSSSMVYDLNRLEGLEELQNVEQTSPVSKIERTNEVAVKIETAFSNKELTTGYYMRTLGLYAIDPEEGEILYAVTAETSGNCYMPAYNGVTVSGAYVQLVTTVGNAESVSLEVNEAGVATIRDIKELESAVQGLRDDLEEGSIRLCFDEYTERENIQPKDTLRTILGKIKRWLSDLGTGAFANIADNCTTTEEGYVLDARQGAVLQEQVNGINGNLTAVPQFIINSSGKITGYKTKAGADTVFPFTNIANSASWIGLNANTNYSCKVGDIFILSTESENSLSTLLSSGAKTVTFRRGSIVSSERYYYTQVVVSTSNSIRLSIYAQICKITI